jgi:uncharacterized protein YndB with AHSA1/START domain
VTEPSDADTDGPFAAGSTVRGQLTIPGYDHLMLDLQIERIQPESYFSYRWHPYAVDPNVDYSAEPTTLVEFRFEAIPRGTRLTITESGIAALPEARRIKVLRDNTEGWNIQARNIAEHVAARR